MIKEKKLGQFYRQINCVGAGTSAPDKNLCDFKMELDDARILAKFYKRTQPKRHLEIGTWKGFGTKLVLENSRATCWTVNPWEGEKEKGGASVYSETVLLEKPAPLFQRLFKQHESLKTGITIQTDHGPSIGHLYREAGLGGRVCQIYSHSQDWDTTNYPQNFFDTVLIDGSHQPSSVVNDTKKTVPLLRTGGVMIWHDYCPRPGVIACMRSVQGVTEGIQRLLPFLRKHFKECFWINPSWLLIGFKK